LKAAAQTGYRPRNVPSKTNLPLSLGRLALLGALSLSVASCASAGEYVWFKDVPVSEWGAAAGEYVIGVGDSISIKVYEQENLSGTFKIRRDGRIELPLAGELLVAGKRP
jgi:protein involved in polysaccharide export with SLBB domain